jgi:hypothetical protein
LGGKGEGDGRAYSRFSARIERLRRRFVEKRRDRIERSNSVDLFALFFLASSLNDAGEPVAPFAALRS